MSDINVDSMISDSIIVLPFTYFMCLEVYCILEMELKKNQVHLDVLNEIVKNKIGLSTKNKLQNKVTFHSNK